MTAREALARAGLDPITLAPKESLVLMNGTAMSTALACLAWHRTQALARLAARVTAAASLALAGNPQHFDPRLHAAKPHPGQAQVADWIRDDLAGGDPGRPMERLQDRYSIRCAPQVVGVLCDAAHHAREILETELNGVSDNPIIVDDEILHGGNFYGGHLAHACDSLKTAVANIACLLDRQVMLLCSPHENAGLPRDLVGVDGPLAAVHNGFKAASIAASSLAAEALKATMPASVFSRSTELHNQDKVPMAPIAARDLLAIVELTEEVAAIAVLAVCQALDLSDARPGPALAAFHETVRGVAPRLREDRRMDLDQAAVRALIVSDGLEAPASPPR
jgi:histidine ammonia-lyase